MKNIIKNTAILTVITLVAGLLLGYVYDITKEPIAKSKEAAKNAAYQTVMAEADTFELMEVEAADLGTGCDVDEVVAANAGSDLKGYVITTTTHDGYGGDIQVSGGVAADGTIEVGPQTFKIFIFARNN